MDFQEFEKATSELVKEVQMLSMHWDLLEKLNNELIARPDDFVESQHFWSMTFNAHLTSVRIILSRVYEKNDSVLSLYSWLKALNNGLNNFKFEYFEPNNDIKESINNDLVKCNPECNKKIHTLIHLLRNNSIAHTNMKYAKLGRCIFQEYELEEVDYKNLIIQAQLILNNYTPYILGCNISYESLHKDDYKKVVNK